MDSVSANGGKMVESDEQPKRDSSSGGGGAAMAALHQCELIQNMIEISISSLQGLRTKCAASNDLTQQEIRTLEVGEDPLPRPTSLLNTHARTTLLFAVQPALSLVPLAESRRVKMRSHEAPSCPPPMSTLCSRMSSDAALCRPRASLLFCVDGWIDRWMDRRTCGFYISINLNMYIL